MKNNKPSQQLKKKYFLLYTYVLRPVGGVGSLTYISCCNKSCKSEYIYNHCYNA